MFGPKSEVPAVGAEEPDGSFGWADSPHPDRRRTAPKDRHNRALFTRSFFFIVCLSLFVFLTGGFGGHSRPPFPCPVRKTKRALRDMTPARHAKTAHTRKNPLLCGGRKGYNNVVVRISPLCGWSCHPRRPVGIRSIHGLLHDSVFLKNILPYGPCLVNEGQEDPIQRRWFYALRPSRDPRSLLGGGQ